MSRKLQKLSVKDLKKKIKEMAEEETYEKYKRQIEDLDEDDKKAFLIKKILKYEKAKESESSSESGSSDSAEEFEMPSSKAAFVKLSISEQKKIAKKHNIKWTSREEVGEMLKQLGLFKKKPKKKASKITEEDLEELSPEEKAKIKDLSAYTVVKLKERARKHGISVPASILKKDLIKLIVEGESKNSPSKASKTSKGTPTLKKSKTSKEEKDEEEPSKKSKTEKTSKKSKSPKLSHEDLVNKGIDDLNAMMEKEGLTSYTKDPEEAAELIEQYQKHGKCSDEEPCGDGLVCDVSADPGVCVDEKTAARDGVKWISYNGKNIVGNKKAIKKFIKKIGGVENLDEVDMDSEDSSKHEKYAEKLKEMGVDYEGTLTTKQMKKIAKIKKLREGSSIEEDDGGMAEPSSGSEPSESSDSSESSEPKKKKSKKAKKTEDSEESDESFPPKKARKTKKALEEEEPEESEEPEEPKKKSKKDKNSKDAEDVENLLMEVLGDKKDKISDFDKVQKTVLKCLGLLKA